MTFVDKLWKLERSAAAPDSSERFKGTIDEDGDTIVARWEHSSDGSTWDDDFATHLHARPLTVRHHRPNVRPVIRARQSQVGFWRATCPGLLVAVSQPQKQLDDRHWVDGLSEVVESARRACRRIAASQLRRMASLPGRMTSQ
jgi:hypothetical protein